MKKFFKSIASKFSWMIAGAILLGSFPLALASNITYLPLQDNYIQELTQTLGDEATDLTISVDEVPVYSPSTSDTFAVIEPGTSRAEVVLIDSYDSGASTLTVAGGGRGQNLYLGDARATKRFEHPAGSSVVISDNYIFWQTIQTAVNTKLDQTGGNTSTTFDLDLSGSNFRIRKDGNDMKFTDDNQSEVSLSTLAAAAGANDKVKASVADTTAGYLQGKFNAGDGLDEAIGTPAGNETLDVSVDVTDFIDTSYGLTEDTNNIRVNLAANPGLEFTVGALRVKVKAGGGITLDADGLSLTNAFYPKASGVASEAITEGQAVASLPVEYKWSTGLTDVAENLGAAETVEGFAMKIIPTKNITGITSINFRAAEAVNASTALGNLVITVQTDNAGAPSGTLVDANATSTVTQVTQRTWNTTLNSRSSNFTGAFNLTKGTTYWVSFRVSAFNAANYLKLGDLSTYDENYVNTTRLTFDAAAATWGSSTTTDPIAFWFNTGLGNGLVPTDANFGRRTWECVGIADANYSIGNSVDYYNDLVPIDDLGLSLTDYNADYYLSTTAGQLSTSVPNWSYGNDFKYKIGGLILDSTGATLLKIDFGVMESVVAYSQSTASTFYYPLWFKPSQLEAVSNTGGAGQYWGDNSSLYDGSTTFNNGSQISGNFLDNNDGNAAGLATATTAILDVGFSITQTGANSLVARIHAKAG